MPQEKAMICQATIPLPFGDFTSEGRGLPENCIGVSGRRKFWGLTRRSVASGGCASFDHLFRDGKETSGKLRFND